MGFVPSVICGGKTQLTNRLGVNIALTKLNQRNEHLVVQTSILNAPCLYSSSVTNILVCVGKKSELPICIMLWGSQRDKEPVFSELCWIIVIHEANVLLLYTLQNTKHYELLNYSEHGTTVDNVLYSCDFSEKVLPTPPSSIVAKVQNVISKSSHTLGMDQHCAYTAFGAKPFQLLCKWLECFCIVLNKLQW